MKAQSNFQHLRRDAGYLDKDEAKQKLIKDIKKRQLYKFSLQGMEFVQIEKDKYYNKQSEFLEQQLKLMDIAANAKSKVDDKWTSNPYQVTKRNSDKNFVQRNMEMQKRSVISRSPQMNSDIKAPTCQVKAKAP